MKISQKGNGSWVAVFIKYKSFLRKEKYIIVANSYNEAKTQAQYIKNITF